MLVRWSVDLRHSSLAPLPLIQLTCGNANTSVWCPIFTPLFPVLLCLSRLKLISSSSHWLFEYLCVRHLIVQCYVIVKTSCFGTWWSVVQKKMLSPLLHVLYIKIKKTNCCHKPLNVRANGNPWLKIRSRAFLREEVTGTSLKRCEECEFFKQHFHKATLS